MTRHRFLAALDDLVLARPHGLVRKVAQGHFEADGPALTVGELCEILGDGPRVVAEVVGADASKLTLVPLRKARAVRPGDQVFQLGGGGAVPVGPDFAGRAVDALGQPIDSKPPVRTEEHWPIEGRMPAALDRVAPLRPVVTGMRAIDGLLTLGEGQRIGIFAASGVGKTSLVEQLAVQIRCDRVVLCLVGERGREVEGMWQELARRDDRERFTVVAATSDETAALRARSVATALCLAEYWREQGEHVLLVIDSITRLAMALRETGLAAGEPPTLRAYTPNVFAALPRIVERCGAVRGGGAITAIMTVLSETDDVDDPIVEVMKALLDGHVVLSRTLAERGQFPAIDVSRSISRQATRLMTPEHAEAAQSAVALLGVYEEARVMIESGMYKAGASSEIDRAIAVRANLLAWLRQRRDEAALPGDAVRQLREALRNG